MNLDRIFTLMEIATAFIVLFIAATVVYCLHRRRKGD